MNACGLLLYITAYFVYPPTDYRLPAALYSDTALSSPATANCLPTAKESFPLGCHLNPQTSAVVVFVETHALCPTSHNLIILSAPLPISCALCEGRELTRFLEALNLATQLR
jgi:hypothetical protein